MDGNTRCTIEDEIDLRDYINVIKKRKKIILFLVFASLIVTAVIIFTRPEIYEVSMIIEPPAYRTAASATSVGATQYLDSAKNIAGIIKSGVFDYRIIESLGLEGEKRILKFEVRQLEGLPLIKISLIQSEKFHDACKDILNALFQKLTLHYHDSVDNQISLFELDAETRRNRISVLNNEINQKDRDYKILEKRSVELTGEIGTVGKNTEKLFLQRDSLMDAQGADKMSLLLYINTIQQNISLSSQLKQELIDLSMRMESALTRIKNLQNEIDSEEITLKRLNLQKESTSNVRMIQGAEVSFEPVGQRRILVLITAGILSLILSVFFAFSMELRQDSTPKKIKQSTR